MDISLFYQEKGEGEALILLHGNGENGAYFDKQIEFFSDKYRVIAVDTRGHGNSPRGTAPFTMEQFAKDLYELMALLDIPRAIILGFSDGANIAMKFTLMYPEKIRALILNGGNVNTKGIKRAVQIPIEIGYKTAKIFAGKSEEAKHNMEILGLMVNEPNIRFEELHLIHVPTLVIAGTKDMVKRAHTEEIAKNIPDARLSIIQGDHFIASREADRFNQEVSSFLMAIN